MEAARGEVQVARAQFYPNINLAGFLGFQSLGFDNLLKGGSFQWGVGPALRLPIFDGGRLRADVDIQRSRQRELLEAHRSNILTALKEVEDALANATRDANQESAQREILTEAQRSLRLAELRYREGADGLLTVLDAQRTLFSAQDQLAQLRLARFGDAVNLYKALGGGWSAERADG